MWLTVMMPTLSTNTSTNTKRKSILLMSMKGASTMARAIGNNLCWSAEQPAAHDENNIEAEPVVLQILF